MDIPKTFGNSYGVGAGTSLDTEILCYMKVSVTNSAHSLFSKRVIVATGPGLARESADRITDGRYAGENREGTLCIV